MSNPDADDRIQPLPNPTPALRPVELEADAPASSHLVAGMSFGAYAGLLMAPPVAAVSCWLTDWYEGRWLSLYVAAVLGPLGGALVGLRERKARGPLARPDVATVIGALCGFLPALLVGVGGLGVIGGAVFGLFCVGAVFIGPAVGLLLGAILDRAYEALLRRAWLAGLLRMAIGSAVCIGIVLAALDAPYGPEPQEVARDVRNAIFEQWKAQPELDAKLGDLVVERKGGREYIGTMDATIAGHRERYRLDIVVDGAIVRWTQHRLPE